ncbi:acetylxylan esterase, partial [candidate division KSB1 bacterium]|nr:acetylxylan esterase [candidate division KSB1 bacterium]
MDDKFVYVIGTREIGKYEKETGKLVAEWREQPDGLILHLDSGIILKDRLYCAHSNYPALPMTSSVEIWDTRTLQPVGSHSFGIQWGSCTWIDRFDGFWWAVFANYDQFHTSLLKDNRWTTLVKFNDAWQPVASWVFPEKVLALMKPMSNSGGSWGPDKLLYCTGHDKREIYTFYLPEKGSILQLQEIIPFNCPGQGIAWDRLLPTRLYGIDREKKEVVVSKLVPPKPLLRREKFQSETAGREELERFSQTYSNKSEWEIRAKTIREGIRKGAKLSPLPKRCPLNPIIYSKRVYEGYTVENAAFESLPGFYVTGNLYRPEGMKPPFAAILCPHGHFKDGRFRPDHQYRCATFARMGAVVFAYDLIGWGESTQFGNYSYPESHQTFPEAVALQTWNSMRVIDFLTSLKEVDPQRIGVTGASGGGTQTFLVAALDERVAVSVPAVMV